MAAKTLTPVRIVTTMRTGSCPEGYVTEDRTLRPLTKAERKAGKPDELKEWYATHGSVRPVRRVHRHQPDKIRPPRPEPVPNDPPKEVQDEVYREIVGNLRRVSLDLARSQFISYSDIADMEHELFRAAIDDLPKWDPAKASRKTYLYEVTATNKIDAVRSLNAKKAQGGYAQGREPGDRTVQRTRSVRQLRASDDVPLEPEGHARREAVFVLRLPTGHEETRPDLRDQARERLDGSGHRGARA